MDQPEAYIIDGGTFGFAIHDVGAKVVRCYISGHNYFPEMERLSHNLLGLQKQGEPRESSEITDILLDNKHLFW